jgi:Do/DeqQ family serine protease
MKKSLLVLLVLVASGIGAVVGGLLAIRWLEPAAAYQSIEKHQQRIVATGGGGLSSAVVGALNFKEASAKVVPAVVHIRASFGSGSFSLNAIDQFLNPHARSSGSGVIISDDGYIVTNNHVIEDATNLEVVLNNNQRFFAKVIGRDPNTDLALLKIRATQLPFVKYGDSDAIESGDWVLAVGNPFDLTSTVTAGIVSAKARNIDILRDRNNLQVESFIQTDAAVNPGNSGGALVNLAGELVGINTAIATATGGYAGYSFAIPVSLVKKVMDDLLEFGSVQRGMLGIQIVNVTNELADEEHLDVVQGVYVTNVNRDGAARQSGLETGDVITAINNHPVNSVSELQEWVARNRPGQSVRVTFRRGGAEKEVKAVLKDFEGREEPTPEPVMYEIQGARFEDLNYRELTELQLEGGARILAIEPGPWKEKDGLAPGSIITHIDKVALDDVRDLNRVLAMKRGAVLIEGRRPDGGRLVAAIDW